MDFILEHKWIILLVLELFAWSLTFFIFYARYWMESKVWFQVGVVLYALTGIIPQVILGIINFFDKGTFDLFTVVVILLILYGFTIGKDHVRRMDAWIYHRFNKRRNKV